MQLEKSQNPISSEISVEITDAGIKRVVIYADTPAEQSRAHMLLARIASEMVGLDRALKTAK
jgi:hypothetical protein